MTAVEQPPHDSASLHPEERVVLELHLKAELDPEQAQRAYLWTTAVCAAIGDLAAGNIVVSTTAQMPTTQWEIAAAQRQIEQYMLERVRGERLKQLGLTAREMQVAELVAQARTNNEIGEELQISWHTAKYHIHKIARKLGVENRAGIAAIIRGAGPN